MLKEYIREKSQLIDSTLNDLVTINEEYNTIYTSMRYSLFAGGKRLRPILFFAACDAVKGSGNKYVNIACALEMIHTYSLIHDDLPSMDNDDLRRGKPTNHKVYGEGMAVLAGDGLLTKAFEVILSQQGVEPVVLMAVAREIAQAAGASGMVGGQAIDLEAEGKNLDLENLKKMHAAKTGALFKASLRSGAILGGGSAEQVQALTEFAEYFGLAFQITDDILDVEGTSEEIGKPIGSDIKNNKATYVSIYSLMEAKAFAEETVKKALESIQSFGVEANFLRELVRYLLLRSN